MVERTVENFIFAMVALFKMVATVALSITANKSTDSLNIV
jgi:hypothetical protein